MVSPSFTEPKPNPKPGIEFAPKMPKEHYKENWKRKQMWEPLTGQQNREIMVINKVVLKKIQKKERKEAI